MEDEKLSLFKKELEIWKTERKNWDGYKLQIGYFIEIKKNINKIISELSSKEDSYFELIDEKKRVLSDDYYSGKIDRETLLSKLKSDFPILYLIYSTFENTNALNAMKVASRYIVDGLLKKVSLKDYYLFFKDIFDNKLPRKIYGTTSMSFELFGFYNLDKDKLIYNNKHVEFFKYFYGKKSNSPVDLHEEIKDYRFNYSSFFKDIELTKINDLLSKGDLKLNSSERKNVQLNLQLDQFIEFVSRSDSFKDNSTIGDSKKSAFPKSIKETEVISDYLKEINLLEKKKQIILYGPAGTGKTWSVSKIIDKHKETFFKKNSEENFKSFWWVSTNINEWDYADYLDEEVNFSGRPKKNFEKASVGDYVLGYVSTPKKELSWLGLVVDINTSSKESPLKIKVVGSIPNKLSWDAIKKDSVLKNSEPVKNNAQGTLFSLTIPEAKQIYSLCSMDFPSKKAHIKNISFHQSYSYEEFIEGLKPDLKNKEISYLIESGIFKKICSLAKQNESEPFYLLIDEINRGNISKIFGELITLLEQDKRLGELNELVTTLPYSKDSFGVPSNVYIIGTMNTSDKSIAQLDLALRRRFGFVEMLPNPSLVKNESFEGINLGSLLTCLNNRLEFLLDKDHLIGHSYFMSINSIEDLKEVFYNEIIPLLEEFFYGDYQQLSLVLGSDFISKNNNKTAKKLFEDIDTLDPEKSLIRINDFMDNKGVFDSEGFIKAIKKIVYFPKKDDEE